jgi:Fe2+ or Zn2+ uptake regulation protein
MKAHSAQPKAVPIPGPERQRYDWAMMLLKRANVRLTLPRRRILQALVNRPLPVSLDVLGEELAAECDLATIYRTMRSFQKAGIVRQVHLVPERACYVLGAPGEPCGYLVCRKCGAVTSLPEAKSVMELGKKIAVEAGFRILQQEVEFFGICGKCQRGC